MDSPALVLVVRNVLKKDPIESVDSWLFSETESGCCRKPFGDSGSFSGLNWSPDRTAMMQAALEIQVAGKICFCRRMFGDAGIQLALGQTH